MTIKGVTPVVNVSDGAEEPRMARVVGLEARFTWNDGG